MVRKILRPKVQIDKKQVLKALGCDETSLSYEAMSRCYDEVIGHVRALLMPEVRIYLLDEGKICKLARLVTALTAIFKKLSETAAVCTLCLLMQLRTVHCS